MVIIIPIHKSNKLHAMLVPSFTQLISELLCVTTRFASLVHTSLIVKPSASKAATVLTDAGAALASHPSTFVVEILPGTTGSVLLSKLIVYTDVFTFRYASFTR